MHSKEKATLGRPELGFDGAWDGDYYYCGPCPGWGAIVYEVPGGVLNLQFFTRRGKPSLKEGYVAAVLRSATPSLPESRIEPYKTGIRDWLTVTCILLNFAEEHSE